MKPWVATVPRMAQLKSVKKPRMAQQRASWPRVAQLGGSRPRVAQQRASRPRVAQRETSGPRVAQLVQGPQVA